jgi:hypothetical protein
MQLNKSDIVPTMKGPANYRIRVRGRPEADWSDRLGGMTITSTLQPDETVVSTLTGWLADQAALSGILNTLYELHLPVLCVECLDSGLCKEE